MNAKIIGYWITTSLLASILLSGGFWLLIYSQDTVAGTPLLKLPAYIFMIVGFWKILGGAAILLPRTPLIKEWAYAGIFFNMTGAAAARALSGDSTPHIIAPILITGLTITSWYLRPDSKKLSHQGW
ncbi:MAG: DoxX family protein [Pyrinomonadaceae bacterium]